MIGAQMMNGSGPVRDYCSPYPEILAKGDRVVSMQLYHLWNCPYSAKVRDCIQRHGLAEQFEYIDIEEVPGSEEQLLELTGRVQVPCLVVNGRPMLDSTVIVNWLEANMLPKGEARP